MLEVIVFAEGQTEEQFLKRVVAPSLHSRQIYVKAFTLQTSQQGRGGAISFDRLLHNAKNTLKQHREAILSTFLDLYGLDTDFPEFAAAKAMGGLTERVRRLEEAMHQAVVNHVHCRPERFIPHIQPHEFEGLLFADVQALSSTEPRWANYLEKLQAVRNQFETPEHINDSYETKPSRRLESLLRPGYKKVRHGPLAAGRVTLATMEAECPHFQSWMAKLRALAL